MKSNPWYDPAMKEFFDGWRRKAGIVTLAMALVSAGIWVRGTVVTDQFYVGDSKQYRALEVRQDCLLWGRVQAFGNATIGSAEFWTVAKRDEIGTYLRLMHSTPTKSGWEWRWVGFGFDFGRTEIELGGNDVQLTLWAIPHWFTTIPLTLLSAGLILWKPRKQ